MICSTRKTCNQCSNDLLCSDQGECLEAKNQLLITQLAAKIVGVFTGEDARKRCEGLSSAQILTIARREDESNDTEQTTPSKP